MHAKTMPDMLTITRPDDWHLHLRDGEPMRSVVGATARVFARAVVMPNLDPPVTTVAAAAAYRDRVVAALPPESGFTPLSTLYLTDDTRPAEIERARASGFIIGVKY
jgi:dihydroorotase